MSPGRTAAAWTLLTESRQRRCRCLRTGRRRALPDRPDPIRQRDIAFERLDGRKQRRLDHQQFWRGVAQDVAELDAAQRRVERHSHRPHPGAAEINLQEFRPVRTHQSDAVAWAKSGLQSGERPMQPRSRPSRRRSIVSLRRRRECDHHIARPDASGWSRGPDRPAGNVRPHATRSARPALARPRCDHLLAHAPPGLLPSGSTSSFAKSDLGRRSLWPAR